MEGLRGKPGDRWFADVNLSSPNDVDVDNDDIIIINLQVPVGSSPCFKESLPGC